MNQLKTHDSMYIEIANSEHIYVLNVTGCKLPCFYRVIQSVGTPLPMAYARWWKQWTCDILSDSCHNWSRVKSEALVCRFISLVFDIGGSLWLFIGFSFFLLWDWIMYICYIYKASRIFIWTNIICLSGILHYKNYFVNYVIETSKDFLKHLNVQRSGI